jgi:hypothetical protein
MHYLLHYAGGDSKDMSFNGTIYNKKKTIVKTIFDKGNVLKESEILSPFTIILNEKQSSIKKTKQNDKIPTYVIDSGNLFLISSPARALFEKQKINNLQYFDVTIKSSALEISDYKIVNITDKIDCADLDASDLELYDDGGIDTISSLVLKESKIPKGTKIFLLGKRSTGIIIVHEDLKKAIEQAKLTGFIFVELNRAGLLY